MPQMAPLNWLALMLYFLLIFMLINIFNFYVISPTMNYKSKIKLPYSSNWKW